MFLPTLSLENKNCFLSIKVLVLDIRGQSTRLRFSAAFSFFKRRFCSVQLYTDWKTATAVPICAPVELIVGTLDVSNNRQPGDPIELNTLLKHSTLSIELCNILQNNAVWTQRVLGRSEITWSADPLALMLSIQVLRLLGLEFKISSPIKLSNQPTRAYFFPLSPSKFI